MWCEQLRKKKKKKKSEGVRASNSFEIWAFQLTSFRDFLDYLGLQEVHRLLGSVKHSDNVLRELVGFGHL